MVPFFKLNIIEVLKKNSRKDTINLFKKKKCFLKVLRKNDFLKLSTVIELFKKILEIIFFLSCLISKKESKGRGSMLGKNTILSWVFLLTDDDNTRLVFNSCFSWFSFNRKIRLIFKL